MGTMVSGVETVLELDAELLGGVTSEPFFLMWSARTLPRVAVLRTELSRLREEVVEVVMRGIWMRSVECLGSICGTGGASTSVGLLDPDDLTLTTAAFPRTMVWAGSGETMAFWLYMVEATLVRARLGAMLVRAYEL